MISFALCVVSMVIFCKPAEAVLETILFRTGGRSGCAFECRGARHRAPPRKLQEERNHS